MMNNFDKNIEDFGWGEMKKLLDKEMPEGGIYVPASATDMPLSAQKDKDKRRWFIFFLLVSGILASGLGYYFYQKPTSKTPIAQAVKPVIVEENSSKNAKNTEGVGNTEKTVSKTLNNITEQRSANFSLKNTVTPIHAERDDAKRIHSDEAESVKGVSRHNNDGTSKNQNTNIDIKNDLINQNIITQNIDNQNIINKNNETKNNKITKENTSITTLKEGNDNQSNIPKTDMPDVNREPTKVISTLELLPIIVYKEIAFDRPLLPIALPMTQALQGKIISVHIKNKPHFGLTVGAHTEGISIMDGFQGGIFIQQKMSTKLPITLQIGLNYRNMNTNGDSLNAQPIAPASVSSAPSILNTFVITQASLNNISYIEMPVFLTYSLSKKWSFLGGVKGSYMISNKKSTTIWSANNRYVVENGFSGTLYDMQFKSTNATLNSLDNFSQTLSFNRWDIAALGGVSYTVFPKTTLTLRADWGLKNILNKQNWSANNRFLGLNMYYQF
jgi:hypothetical protein